MIASTTPSVPVPRLSAPRRRTLLVACLAGAVPVMCMLSLMIGSRDVPFDQVVGAFVRPTGSLSEQVVMDLRVPRTLLGLLVGVALGLAGTVIQGLTRNPLADPGLLGIEAGAALAVVLYITMVGDAGTGTYAGLAMLGAALAAVLVYRIAAIGMRSASPVTLVLAGVALSAILGSISTMMLLSSVEATDEFRFWVIGSIAGRTMPLVLEVAPLIVLGAIVALTLGRTLNALSLGDDVATSLGFNVRRARLLGFITVVWLTGAAVAVAGPLAFVGLVSAFVARAVVGTDYRRVLVAAMLVGPLLVLGADIVGRVVARPGEIDVGVLITAIGAPLLVAIAMRRRLPQI